MLPVFTTFRVLADRILAWCIFLNKILFTQKLIWQTANVGQSGILVWLTGWYQKQLPNYHENDIMGTKRWRDTYTLQEEQEEQGVTSD